MYSEVLRMAPREEAIGIHVGRPAELHDPLGDEIGVALLLVGVLEELSGHRLGVDARRHVVVALVTQDAHELRRERFVEQAQDGLAVRAIAFGDRAFLHMAAGPSTKLLDIRERWSVHGALSFLAACRRRCFENCEEHANPRPDSHLR